MSDSRCFTIGKDDVIPEIYVEAPDECGEMFIKQKKPLQNEIFTARLMGREIPVFLSYLAMFGALSPYVKQDGGEFDQLNARIMGFYFTPQQARVLFMFLEQDGILD